MELFLESIASSGGMLDTLTLYPTGWQVRYWHGSNRREEHPHIERLPLVVGDATARALSPVVLRRWGLVYEEPEGRFDVWTWRLPGGTPPSHDGRLYTAAA